MIAEPRILFDALVGNPLAPLLLDYMHDTALVSGWDPEYCILIKTYADSLREIYPAPTRDEDCLVPRKVNGAWRMVPRGPTGATDNAK